MAYLILALNPGSTSTKLAVYEDERRLFADNLDHDEQALAACADVNAQFPLRRQAVLEALARRGFDQTRLAAVVGRGGMLPPVQAGGYFVDAAMKDCILSGRAQPHASNLGALIADAVAAPLHIPAYIYDAVSADEFRPVAKITGIPEVVRQSFCHVLNAKAVARKAAAELGGSYQQMNFLVAHLGGGISISAHDHGRIVDAIPDDAGPFSPERSGSVPLRYIVDMCYSGRYSRGEILGKLRGKGGIKAYLGTYNMREVERMADAGDAQAAALFEAQAYQIAKGLGELAPVLYGRIDAVLLTGGLAHSQRLMARIRDYVAFLGPVLVYPGENELEALALGALRILRGEETAAHFIA